MYTWKTRSGTPKLPKRIPVGRHTYKNNTSNLRLNKGTVNIGAGAYGTVSAYFKANGKTVYAVKKADDLGNEIRIMRKIRSIIPTAVPTVYSNNKNTNLTTNFIKGGALDDWLKKPGVTDNDVRLVIIQVLKILQHIAQKNPSFRHNDLHCGNILIDDDANKKSVNATGVRALLTDFGLARDSDIPCLTFEGPTHDIGYAQVLRSEYGIYVGNDKMYDAAFFLESVKSRTKSPNIKRIIKNLMKGTKIINESRRLEPGAKFNYSYRYLISFFDPYDNVNINASRLFTIIPKSLSKAKKSLPNPRSRSVYTVRMFRNAERYLNIVKAWSPNKPKTPAKTRTPNKPKTPTALERFAAGKTITEMIRMPNIRNRFPNTTNATFLKTLGFIPRATKVNVKLPNAFKSPAKLKQAATLGASRFKNKTIKKSSPKAKVKRARAPSPFKPSPFNQKKFDTAKLNVLRPVNIENYFKSKGKTEADAKAKIENIVRSKRKEAWEKAQEMLKGQVKISRR